MLLELVDEFRSSSRTSALNALCWALAALSLATPAAGQGGWEAVVGGGAVAANGFGDADNQAASAMAEFGGRLYVATGGDAGTPFVMRSTEDGVSWTPVTEDGFGDVGNQGVVAMAVFAGFLYAGTTNPVTGAEVWRTGDGSVWSQVGPSGFGSAANEAISAFEVFGGQLYAGIENRTLGGAIYRSPEGTSWIPTMIGGFGDPAIVAVSSLAGYGSRLYAGTYRESADHDQPGELWWTDDFMTWHSAAAAGFGDDYNVAIVSLEEHAGYLFAGTSQLNPIFGSGFEIWRSDGQSWEMVIVPGNGSSLSTTAVRLTEYLGELYVGVDNLLTGAKIYRFVGVFDWVPETTNGFGDTGNLAITSLAPLGFDLYAGTLNQTAGCEVWRRPGPIFADGFDFGDTGAWSATVP